MKDKIHNFSIRKGDKCLNCDMTLDLSMIFPCVPGQSIRTTINEMYKELMRELYKMEPEERAKYPWLSNENIENGESNAL